MKTADQAEVAIVVESYDHDENQVVIARSPEERHHHFLFLSKHPQVNFGDFLIMNFNLERFYVSYGNPQLTFRILPLVFPGTLLLELLLDKMDN